MMDREGLAGNRVTRGALIVAGTASLMMGAVGVVVPVLPTTPFLLLSAACYARGSRRFHDWLLGNRLLGGYIRDYREGRGMSPRAKAFTLTMLWATISLSALLFVDGAWPKAALLLVAMAVTAHILTIGTPRGQVGGRD